MNTSKTLLLTGIIILGLMALADRLPIPGVHGLVTSVKAE